MSVDGFINDDIDSKRHRYVIIITTIILLLHAIVPIIGRKNI